MIDMDYTDYLYKSIGVTTPKNRCNPRAKIAEIRHDAMSWS
jgi:hypothetical protein